MLTVTEMRNALTGSFLLARRDTGGLRFFDVSIDGFWRSFLVVVPIAPFYVWYAIQEIEIAREINPEGTYLVMNAGFMATRIILLVLDWLIFPVAMIFITRLVGLWPKYVAFIAIYNWSSLFIILALAPLALLFALGIISAQMAGLINLLAASLVLYYRWYIVRIVLETTITTAVMIVSFDVILGLLVHGLFGRLTGY